MDPITLIFNVDIAALQKLGVDPTTSEGKAELHALLIECLNDGLRRHDEVRQSFGERMAWGGKKAEIVRLLLGEGAI